MEDGVEVTGAEVGAQEAADIRAHLFQAGGAAEFFEVEAEVGERCDDGEDD